MSSLLQIWNHWEIQLMVLTSFVLQLFLFVTGSLRRRKISGPLRVSIWLAYVGAVFVAVYAIGLFSHYEEQYILGRKSFRGAYPFLWVPFLLVHLGGQDSITAFSMEDNNLWLRHLLNLGIQGTLALYVFWKSIRRMNWQVLLSASFMFVAGIIKYGERIWALRTGSREGLGNSSLKRKEQQPPQGQIHANGGGRCISSRVRASYALGTVHLAQALFVGRTILQLGNGAKAHFEKYFKTDGVEAEEKVKIIEMELGMMFDLLFTKAVVLQRKTGRIFRRAAQVSMVVAFVLFVVQDQHAHKHSSSSSSSSRGDAAITYTLFVGAILMEVCSVATVVASPWTWAHSDDSTSPFLGWLYSSSSKAFSPVMKAIVRCKKIPWLCQRPSSYSIGQSNYIDFSLSISPAQRKIYKVVNAFGFGTQYYEWNLKRVEAQGIFKYVVRWFDSDISSSMEDEDCFISRRRLNYTLCLPFEHAIYRLRIYTDLHISKHFDVSGRSTGHAADVIDVKEDCEKLSNYMSYLKEVYPSMLPISGVVKGGSFHPEDYGSKRLDVLQGHANQAFNQQEPDSASPFEPLPEGRNDDSDLKRSLEQIRDMWMRLLVYVAGKCSPELHARQLGKGGELLTFVWLLMLHHGLGDAATEMKLLASDVPGLPKPGSVVSAEGGNFGPRPEQPRYAFDFRGHQRQMDLDSNSSQAEEELLLSSMMQLIMPQIIRRGIQVSPQVDETEQDGPPHRAVLLELQNHEPGTSSDAGRDDAATPSSSDIEEQDDVLPDGAK